jgi:hypothetical protein
MRSALALALLVLVASPALAQTTSDDSSCDEKAFDLSRCTDPTDETTCPRACLDPANPNKDECGALPFPELSDLRRVTATQAILRVATVVDGPFSGTVLSRVAVSVQDDGIFLLARDRLCVLPTETPPPPTTPTTGGGAPSGGDPALGVTGGPIWYGPNPGINIFLR